MKTSSAYNDKTFIATNTLKKDNLKLNTNYNTLRKLNDKTLYFDNRQEYELLKAQRLELQERINIRLDYEKTYVHAKKEDMDRELNEIKFKNEIANKRNEDLLNDIQKNVFRIYQSSKNSNHSAELLYKERKRYEDYTNYQFNSIKKEFFSRIQMKQHEILNLKTAFESQVDKNEEMFKLENLYNERMKNMLENFSKNMNNLNDRNMKIAQEREEVIKNYISLENKTYEAINKIMDENKKITENKNLGIQANDFEKLVEKCINNINENMTKAANNANQPKNITILIENNSNNKAEVNNQAQLTSEANIDNLNKNIFTTEIKNDINQIMNLNKESNNIQHSNINPFDNANDQIIIRHVENKDKNENVSKIPVMNSLNNIPNPKSNVNSSNNRASRDTLNVQTSNDTVKKKKKPIHPAEVYNKILRSNSKNNLDNSQSQNKSNMQNSNYFEEGKKNILSDLNRESFKGQSNFDLNKDNNVRKSQKNMNNVNIEEESHNFKSNSNINMNFITTNNEKTATSKFTQLNNTEDFVRGKNISGITNEMLNQIDANHTINGNKINEVKSEPKKNENPLSVSTAKTLLEKLLEEKPDLKYVRKEFKIKVLKKVIAFVEKASKNLKPGHYIYTQKLLSISNKPAIKAKFYEILKNENLDLIGFDINILLLMIGEMLNSSGDLNINPNLLRMKEFNENILESEMNPEAFEIFMLVCEHMKKMIQDKKATLPISTNFLASNFINLEKNDVGYTKLLAILEKKLNQKSKTQDFSNTWNNFKNSAPAGQNTFSPFNFNKPNNVNANFNINSIRDNKNTQSNRQSNNPDSNKNNVFNDYE